MWLRPSTYLGFCRRFTTNASVLSADNAFDHVLYLNHFWPLVATLSENPRNFRALRSLDAALTRVREFDSATSVLVIDGLCRLKKLGRAKTVLVNLKSNLKISTHFLYGLVFDFLVKGGKLRDVEIVWDEVLLSLPRSNRRIEISDYVIRVCKFGDACEIKWVGERILMGGGVLKGQSYVALIGALCRVDEGPLAKEVLIEMFGHGFKEDSLTCLVMFQCFCRNGNFHDADLILRKMVERKLRFDICVYESCIRGLCRSGNFWEADELFHKLIRKQNLDGSRYVFLNSGRRPIFKTNYSVVVPEVVAYETYFRSLCAVGRLDTAEMLLKKMMKKKTVAEACVYGSFIKALFRVGREEDAMKFFAVERKKGLVRVVEIARFVIMELCRKGKIDEALGIFDAVVAGGKFVRDTQLCSCMLDSYLKVGRVSEAENFFERVRCCGFAVPNASMYAIMVDGFFKLGNVSKALSLFNEMLRSSIPADNKLYEVIITRLCDCGRLGEACTYFNEMIENGHVVSCTKWASLFRSKFVERENHLCSQPLLPP